MKGYIHNQVVGIDTKGSDGRILLKPHHKGKEFSDKVDELRRKL